MLKQEDAPLTRTTLIQLDNVLRIKYFVPRTVNACLKQRIAVVESISAMKLNVQTKICTIVPNQTNAFGKTGCAMDLFSVLKETMKILIFVMEWKALLKEPLLNVPKPNDLDTT